MSNNALEISNILLWVLLLLQIMVVIYLAKLVSEFLNRFRLTHRQAEANTLRIGEKAPLFREKDHTGEWIKLSGYSGMTLLLFTHDSCGVCKRVLPYLDKALQSIHGLRVIVVTNASNGKTIKVPAGVHHISSDEVWSNYFVQAVPLGVLIDHTNTILDVNLIKDIKDIMVIVKYVTVKVV